ncbi:MAG: type II toxin-antitoxin system YafQ family toxin [Gammaproteobacteria bacterium]|jgi:mRNA interferase YafQ|nr:type II toxin-antitoxin system YafQ family toxin [Gammaproteobacteria bacterium]
MRIIKQTKRFKRDLTREAKGKHKDALQASFAKVVEILARDLLLPESFRDHGLSGDWSDHRDCHIKPDLVLIDRKPDPETLQLVRIGSHAELGIG